MIPEIRKWVSVTFFALRDLILPLIHPRPNHDHDGEG